jgi:hypothetical protein
MVEAEIMQQLVRDRIRAGLQRSGRKKSIPADSDPAPRQLFASHPETRAKQ